MRGRETDPTAPASAREAGEESVEEPPSGWGTMRTASDAPPR
jgi:hypothetical protein